MINLLKRPTALIPITMSMTALVVLLGYIAIFGVARQTDEGATAHIWQLLMAGQLPVIVLFAIKWFPSHSKQALGVLAVQMGAALCAMLPVYLLHW